MKFDGKVRVKLTERVSRQMTLAETVAIGSKAIILRRWILAESWWNYDSSEWTSLAKSRTETVDIYESCHRCRCHSFSDSGGLKLGVAQVVQSRRKIARSNILHSSIKLRASGDTGECESLGQLSFACNAEGTHKHTLANNRWTWKKQILHINFLLSSRAGSFFTCPGLHWRRFYFCCQSDDIQDEPSYHLIPSESLESPVI